MRRTIAVPVALAPVLMLLLVGLGRAQTGQPVGSIQVVAGRIEGRVIDKSTRRPLYGANVVVLGTRRGTYTKADGAYAIEDVSPGTYRLQFSYIGYQVEIRTDVVVSTSAPVRIDEELIPSSVLAAPITIRPDLFVEELAGPPSTTTLRREEIRRFPGGFEDVVTTATALPGVAQVNRGGRNDLLVRGGGPAENLFLVSGLEVPNINHFSTQGASGGALSFINLDFVDRVEFSTGGFSARFGDRMSSVLELDLRPGRKDHLGGKATISATQFGLNLEGPIGSSGSFVASARKSYLDLIFRAAGVPFVPVYTDYNISTETSLSERDRLSVVGLLARDWIDARRGQAKDRRLIASLLDNNQDQLVVGARIRHLIEDGYTEVVAGYNRASFDLSQADTSAASREYYRSQAVEGESSVKAEVVKKVNPRFELSGGANLKLLGTKNQTSFADSVYDQSGRRVSRRSLGLPASLRDDGTHRKLAIWGQTEHDLSSLWSLTLGLRVDNFAALTRSWYVSPRLALACRPTAGWRLRASLGEYRQSPAAVWLTNPSNRSLKASRCDMAVLGSEILLREDTSLRMETYYKRYRELPGGTDPGSDSTATTDYFVLSNGGVGFGGREDGFRSFGYIPLASRATGEAFGVEVSARKKPSTVPCYGQVSVSVGQSGYRALNGRWLPGQFDQRIILGLSGGYVFNPRWEFSARFRLITGVPYTPVYDPRTNARKPGETQVLPEEYLTRRLNIAHQLDLRTDRRWNFAHWALVTFIDVQDVYNFKAQQPPSWNFADQKVEDRNSIGVLPSVGISAEF